jgi:hypothetical protein
MLFGDVINTLPLNHESKTKDEDLQLLNDILQPKQIEGKFLNINWGKLLPLAILFIVLTLPQVNKFVSFYTKNNVIAVKAILTVLFIIGYLIIDKYF